MADLKEIFVALRDVLLADAAFAALLGQTDGVFLSFPAGVNEKPYLIINFDSLNPQIQVDGRGYYRPEITFDVYVIDPWDIHPVYEHLETTFSIPEKRAASITSANYTITKLTFGESIEVPGSFQEVDSGAQVRQFTISVSIRIQKLTP